jgi:hypothetical protein
MISMGFVKRNIRKGWAMLAVINLLAIVEIAFWPSAVTVIAVTIASALACDLVWFRILYLLYRGN